MSTSSSQYKTIKNEINTNDLSEKIIKIVLTTLKIPDSFTKNNNIDQVINYFQTVIPNPKTNKKIKDKKDMHEELCNNLVTNINKILNTNIKHSIVPIICQDISDFMINLYDSISSTICINETNIIDTYNNLEVLKNNTYNTYNELKKNIDVSKYNYLEKTYKQLGDELNRNMLIYSKYKKQNIDYLMNEHIEFKKIVHQLTDKNKVSVSNISMIITHIIYEFYTIVKLIRHLHNVNEFNKVKINNFTMDYEKLKEIPNEQTCLLYNTVNLLKSPFTNINLINFIQKKGGGIHVTDNDGFSYGISNLDEFRKVSPDNVFSNRVNASKNSIENMLYNKNKEKNRLFKELNNHIKDRYKIITIELHKIKQKLGREIKMNDYFHSFMRQLIFFKQITPDKQNLHKALSGYLRDSSSKFIRNEYIQTLMSLHECVIDCSKHSGGFNDLAKAIKSLIELIDGFNIYMTNKLSNVSVTGGGNNNVDNYMIYGGVINCLSNGYDSGIGMINNVEIGSIDASLPISFIGGSSNINSQINEMIQGGKDSEYNYLMDIQKSINEMEYYYRISNLKINMAVSASQSKNYAKNYQEITSEEYAIIIDNINKKYNWLTCTTEYRNPKKKTINEVYPESSCVMYNKFRSGHNASDFEDYWEGFVLVAEYIRSANVGMLEASLQLDIYLSKFTENIQNNPDNIKNFLHLLNNLEIMAKWFTDKSGDNLVQVFEAFASDDDTNINLLNIKTHYYESLDNTTTQTSVPRQYLQNGIPFRKQLVKEFILLIEKAFKSMKALENVILTFSNIHDDNKDLIHPGTLIPAFMKYSVSSALSLIMPNHESMFSDKLDITTMKLGIKPIGNTVIDGSTPDDINKKWNAEGVPIVGGTKWFTSGLFEINNEIEHANESETISYSKGKSDIVQNIIDKYKTISDTDNLNSNNRKNILMTDIDTIIDRIYDTPDVIKTVAGIFYTIKDNYTKSTADTVTGTINLYLKRRSIINTKLFYTTNDNTSIANLYEAITKLDKFITDGLRAMLTSYEAIKKNCAADPYVSNDMETNYKFSKQTCKTAFDLGNIKYAKIVDDIYNISGKFISDNVLSTTIIEITEMFDCMFSFFDYNQSIVAATADNPKVLTEVENVKDHIQTNITDHIEKLNYSIQICNFLVTDNELDFTNYSDDFINILEYDDIDDQVTKHNNKLVLPTNNPIMLSDFDAIVNNLSDEESKALFRNTYYNILINEQMTSPKSVSELVTLTIPAGSVPFGNSNSLELQLNACLLKLFKNTGGTLGYFDKNNINESVSGVYDWNNFTHFMIEMREKIKFIKDNLEVINSAIDDNTLNDDWWLQYYMTDNNIHTLYNLYDKLFFDNSINYIKHIYSPDFTDLNSIKIKLHENYSGVDIVNNINFFDYNIILFTNIFDNDEFSIKFLQTFLFNHIDLYNALLLDKKKELMPIILPLITEYIYLEANNNKNVFTTKFDELFTDSDLNTMTNAKLIDTTKHGNKFFMLLYDDNTVIDASININDLINSIKFTINGKLPENLLNFKKPEIMENVIKIIVNNDISYMEKYNLLNGISKEQIQFNISNDITTISPEMYKLFEEIKLISTTNKFYNNLNELINNQTKMNIPEMTISSHLYINLFYEYSISGSTITYAFNTAITNIATMNSSLDDTLNIRYDFIKEIINFMRGIECYIKKNIEIGSYLILNTSNFQDDFKRHFKTVINKYIPDFSSEVKTNKPDDPLNITKPLGEKYVLNEEIFNNIIIIFKDSKLFENKHITALQNLFKVFRLFDVAINDPHINKLNFMTGGTIKGGTIKGGSINEYIQTEEIFVMSIKAMVSKVFVVIGAYALFNKPPHNFSTNDGISSRPLRQILGGSNVEIIEEATETYIRLILLTEWYRELFKFNHNAYDDTKPNNSDKVISIVPALDGVWAPLVQTIFIDGLNTNDGNYTETNAKNIIKSINTIYKHFKGKYGSNCCISIMEHFISEINMKYGMIKRSQIDRYLENMYDGLNYKDYNSMDNDDLTLVNYDIKKYDPPSRKYQKVKLDSETKSKLKNKRFLEEMMEFRLNVEQNLTVTNSGSNGKELFDNTSISKYNMDDLIRNTKKRLKSNKPSEHYKIIQSVILGGDRFAHVDQDVMLQFHEQVINPLTILYSTYKILNEWNGFIHILDCGLNYKYTDYDDFINECLKNLGDKATIKKYSDNPRYYFIHRYDTLLYKTNFLYGEEDTCLLNTLISNIFYLCCDKNPMVEIRFTDKFPILSFNNIEKHVRLLVKMVRDSLKYFSKILPHDIISRYATGADPNTTLTPIAGDVPLAVDVHINSLKYIEEHLIDRLLESKYGLDLQSGNIALKNIWLFLMKNTTNVNEMLYNVIYKSKQFISLIPSDENFRCTSEISSFPINRIGIYDKNKMQGDYSTRIIKMMTDRKGHIEPHPFINLVNSNTPIKYNTSGEKEAFGKLPDNIATIMNGNAENMNGDVTTTSPHPIIVSFGLKNIYDRKYNTKYENIAISLIIKFNRLLYNYIEIFTEKTSNKIYMPLLEKLGHSLADEITSLNSSINDIKYNESIYEESTWTSSFKNSILFQTMATAISAILTTKRSLGSTNLYTFVEQDLVNVPSHIRDMMLGTLPIFNKHLNLLINQSKFIKNTIESLKANSNTEANDNIISPYIRTLEKLVKGCEALQSCCNKVYAELKDVPLYFELYDNSIGDYKYKNGHLPFMPLSHVSHLLNNQVRMVSSQQMSTPILHTDRKGVEYTTFDAVSGGGYKGGIVVKGDPRPYDAPIKKKYSRSPVKWTTQVYETKRLTYTEFGLIPRSNLLTGDTSFSFMYGTRGILSDDIEPNIKLAPSIQDNIDIYNNKPEGKTGGKMNNSTVEQSFISSVYLLRYCIDHVHHKTYLIDDDFERSTNHYIIMGNSTTGVNVIDNRNMLRNLSCQTGCHDRGTDNMVTGIINDDKNTFLKSENILSLINNDNYKECVLSIIQCINSNLSNISTYSIRKDMRIYNILDTNIVPINFHAMQKELPFSNLFNYSYTFDHFMRDRFGVLFNQKNRGSDIYGQETRLGLEPYTASNIRHTSDGSRKEYLRSETDYITGVNTDKTALTTTAETKLFDYITGGNLGRNNTRFNYAEDHFVNLLCNPYERNVTLSDYHYNISKIMIGADGISSGRPKYLSDQLWNKVLLNNSYSTVIDDVNSKSIYANMARKTTGSLSGEIPDSLNYPTDQVNNGKKRTTKKSPLDAAHTKRAVVIGYARYNTYIVRSIEWFIQLQRVMRLLMKEYLEWIDGSVVNKLGVTSNAITEYKNDNMFDPDDF